MRYKETLILLSAIWLGCQGAAKKISQLQLEPVHDQHSYSQPEIAKIVHLSLQLTVDFDDHVLVGMASYQIEATPDAEEIILDMSDLTVDSIKGIDKTDHLDFTVGDEQPYLGSPLHISIDSTVAEIHIYYHTHPEADALLWLSPQQTLGKKVPYLFTQGQAVLTRSWLPCQDSPGVRFTYDAEVTVPNELLAIMSAQNPTSRNELGVYHFTMDQPIPSYLMAMVVGDIVFDSIGARTGVYAEPGMIAAASDELADLEDMLITAESLYGPYLWERYDIIILPPSFPFGGMENPRLTFATPTIIAGDRSLTSLVAHELAHSWSGNLVTNATWEDFWINEGHTVYIERRIMESLYGVPYTNMLALLGYQDLTKTIDNLGERHPDTHLKLNLAHRDPDEGMTDVAYEKGFLLLYTLENKVGREVFDQFLKEYFSQFAFQSISTKQWKWFIQEHLLNPQRIEFDLDAWLYEPGLPPEHPIIISDRFQKVDEHVREFVRIARLDRSDTRKWSTHEWLHFIRHLPDDLHVTFYEKLDEVYQISNSGNAEILAAWLELGIRSGYIVQQHQEILKDFLIDIGRRKFLVPLYTALVKEGFHTLARDVFLEAELNYHAVAANSIREILESKPEL